MKWYRRLMSQVTIGDKGRVVIPVSVRRAAGVEVGDELIARAMADGQIVLETRAAIAQRIRARFAGGDGTEGLRSAREADLVLDEQRRAPRPPATQADLASERRRADEILVALGAMPPHAEAS